MFKRSIDIMLGLFQRMRAMKVEIDEKNHLLLKSIKRIVSWDQELDDWTYKMGDCHVGIGFLVYIHLYVFANI